MRDKRSTLSDGQRAFLASLAEYASDNGIDLTSVTRENYRDTVKQLEEIQEKAIAGDLHDYLTNKTEDYSDAVADYFSAKDLSPKKQSYHWNTMLKLLRSEFNIRPQQGEPIIDRTKIMDLVLNVYQMSKLKSDKDPKVPEPKVVERTEALLMKMSRVSRSGYQRRLKNLKGRNFPKDKFLLDIKSNTHNDEDLIPLTDKIAATHVQEMLGLLEPAEQDQYIAALRKSELDRYVPEGYTPHKEGEKTMADNEQNSEEQEVLKTTGQDNQSATEENTATTENTATEENTFTPSAIQQKACGLAGLNWEDYKDAASLMAAVEDKGFKIDGANILKMDGENSSVVATVNEDEQNNNPQPETEEKKEEKKEEEKKEETKEPITFTPLEEERPAPAPTQENDDWIARKAVYYKGLSDNNLIKDYARDETVQNGFAASFDNAQIRYSSPSTVSVSQAAGLNVFDAMLKEPDNKGRKVNFAEDMPPAMAARLYAACLINGNEMGGHVPQLTDEQLKEALGNEEYAAFQQKMAERANGQPETPTQETPVQEVPTQEKQNNPGPTLDTLKDKNIEISRENNNPSQIDLVAKDANGQTTFEFHGELKDFYETKDGYSAKSGEELFDNNGGDNKPLPEADRQFIAEKINGFMLREALMDQYKMAQMEAGGKIIKGRTGDSENAANVTLKGKDCTDDEYNEYKAMEARASHGKSFLAKEFEKDPARVREAAGNIIRDIAAGKTTEMSVTDVREAQIKAVREKMAQNKTDGNSDTLMDHDKKILALSGRLPAGEKAYVTKGGEKQEVKALEGDAKTRFEARNKDAIDRALKNYQSRSNG